MEIYIKLEMLSRTWYNTTSPMKKKQPSLSFQDTDLLKGTPKNHISMVVLVVMANYDLQMVNLSEKNI